MKRLITYITLLLIFSWMGVCAQPKILILSSYRAELKWSGEITRQLEHELMRKYPDAHVYVGYLSIDVALTASLPQMSLRSTLWALTESTDESVAQSMTGNSIFPVGAYADLVVLVGDDAFPLYQGLGMNMGKWNDVPVVLCGGNDLMTTKLFFRSVSGDNFDSLVPVEEMRNYDRFFPGKNASRADSDPDSRRETVNGRAGNWLLQNKHLTGVKSPLQIRQNLNLIHQLIPELEEIVWIDNDYYGSAYAKHLVDMEMKEMMPNVHFSSILHDRINTDSVFNVLFSPSTTNRAYLTYSWAVNGLYSSHSEEQIRSMFRNYSSVPMFSLTEQFVGNNNYWVGGHYRSRNEVVDKTLQVVDRILGGEDAGEIPFDKVEQSAIELDYQLLKKYGLLETAKTIPGVTFLNVPPGFFEANEKEIWIGLIAGVILLGFFILWVKRWMHNKAIKKESISFKRLYDRLNAIYTNSSIDFALYGANGERLLYVLNGKEQKASDDDDLFADNLFETFYLDEKLIRRIKEEKKINTEIIIKRKGFGNKYENRLYQLMINPLQNIEYHSAKYIVLALDLTPLVRERKEKERFESLFNFASNHSNVGIGYYDMNSKEWVATDSWYENLNEESSPGSLPELKNLFPEDRKNIHAYRRKAMSGKASEPFNEDVRVTGADGETHWIQEHIFPAETGQELLIDLNLNIDEQKRSENTLIEAKAKAELANLETQEFLNNINHEVRTPLNAIVGFSAILSISEPGNDTAEQINLIKRNSRLITMLIDDVIELSRIDSGQVTFRSEEINVSELFKELIESNYANIFRKDITILSEVADDEVTVYADRRYLHRLFTNLLSNATKFTDKGTVTLGYRKQRDGSNYFFVKDTGCGIPESEQARIFKRFDKLDSYKQGTGLGLSLCKSIVEHLNGEIGLESEVGVGSLFWFTI